MKHFWTNYHSHSHYCDGVGTLEEQVLGAIEQGVRAFGFSGHSPVFFENEWSMQADKLDEYLTETRLLKEKYAGQIELYTGLEVDYKKTSEYKIPEEFQNKLDKTLILKTAFKALTPGRQRAYILYFSSAKQSKTRESRVDKCLKKILNGKGLND